LSEVNAILILHDYEDLDSLYLTLKIDHVRFVCTKKIRSLTNDFNFIIRPGEKEIISLISKEKLDYRIKNMIKDREQFSVKFRYETDVKEVFNFLNKKIATSITITANEADEIKSRFNQFLENQKRLAAITENQEKSMENIQNTTHGSNNHLTTQSTQEDQNSLKNSKKRTSRAWRKQVVDALIDYYLIKREPLLKKKASLDPVVKFLREEYKIDFEDTIDSRHVISDIIRLVIKPKLRSTSTPSTDNTPTEQGEKKMDSGVLQVEVNQEQETEKKEGIYTKLYRLLSKYYAINELPKKGISLKPLFKVVRDLSEKDLEDSAENRAIISRILSRIRAEQAIRAHLEKEDSDTVEITQEPKNQDNELVLNAQEPREVSIESNLAGTLTPQEITPDELSEEAKQALAPPADLDELLAISTDTTESITEDQTEENKTQAPHKNLTDIEKIQLALNASNATNALEAQIQKLQEELKQVKYAIQFDQNIQEGIKLCQQVAQLQKN
jgi:hypothetical protein